jgi:hypothetical protein
MHNLFKNFAGKTLLSKTWCKWGDKIKTELKTVLEGVVGTHAAGLIQGVSGGIINILGGGSMDYSE